jgi:hypothetical protein
MSEKGDSETCVSHHRHRLAAAALGGEADAAAWLPLVGQCGRARVPDRRPHHFPLGRWLSDKPNRFYESHNGRFG